ncbi:hypothetical protein Tco_0948336, partial [Tanacetum coccineum]
MADAKLAHRVSMSFPTDSICSGGGATAVGGGDGEGDLDLLRDEHGKVMVMQLFIDPWLLYSLVASISLFSSSLRFSSDESSPESSGYPYKAGMHSSDGGASLI